MNRDALRREAAMIEKMTDGDLLRQHGLLDRQFTVLQTRAQVLVSIAGIVVTVTGFSGRIIAGTHIVGQLLVIAGLATVIAAAVYLVGRVLRVRWLTSLLAEESADRLERILYLRELKLAAYRRGGTILLLGLVLYGTAISIMLLYPRM
ncbi:MAG: hypothetical protein PHQ27_06085 [Victivallales bacterium]|nr:hypothetical protein [Victivallales bacterium]